MTDIRIRRYKKDSELANDLFQDTLPSGAVTGVTESKPGEVVDVSVDYDIANAVEDVNNVMTSSGWSFVSEDPVQSLDDAAKDITPQYVTSVHGRQGVVVSQLGDYDATEVTYTPATPADWPESPDPTNEQEAIDYLAARTALIGGGAQVIADTQAVSDNSSIMTSSLVFVPVPGMILTTTNTAPAIYVIWFNAQFEMSTPNKRMHFVLRIDGVQDPDTERDIEISNANAPSYGGTSGWELAVPPSVDIEVLWKVSSGTGTMLGRILIIQGMQSAV
jgi:hypothetical protein